MITTQTQRTKSECTYCGAETESAHFCSECHSILTIAEGTDYFSFFGLPRKLSIDEADLEKTFYALSRQLHPDYFMNASAEEQQASVERSSMLNDAYRTLRDRVARAKYLLSLYGYKEAEKKAPPDLLEEVFELNMEIEELKAARQTADEDEVAEARAALEEALRSLDERMTRIDERLFALFEEWDRAADEAANEDKRKPVLDRMSELLSQRSYVHNLVQDIKEEL
ncbi:MAG TPA: Fe-S protein assembly co-chaperone HscB [Blastocatellia bacterium]|nr:Fe-S protein assembly co-chaperone HscB [Blastocatellia bacterium]